MLYLVIGPPAAGKSTWVKQQAVRGDIVIDFDLLAHALTIDHDGSHEHTDDVKAVTKAARQAAIDKAVSLAQRVDVFLIHSTPSTKLVTRYRQLGAEVIEIDPGIDIVMARAKRERPWWMQQVIKQWYADKAQQRTKEPAVRRPRTTTTERGLGYEHQKNRKRLLANHIDGKPCWWCGRPMYLADTRNWDNEALAADHTLTRAMHNGTKADRLLHGICNKQRGDGSRDHMRPTMTGKEPATDAARAPRPAAMRWP